MEARLRDLLGRHRRLGLDTSVLIYHFEDVPPYSSFTEALFCAAGRGEVELLIPSLCVAELLVKPWEAGEEKAKEALSLLLGLPSARFLPPGVEEAHAAARLRARYGLRLPDALILATVQAAGATALLTNDREFLKVKEGVDVILLDECLAP
ncbi:MAG: type II toxin-antitoxin system VapC family toxin [Candidatus Bipolaricaulota bacterium]|nr:type II toxin-antitoxin system VapC family toxin [Candidatus Bipolaricaulota bacterium]MDW8126982.1 type II toxin-antitoxin system VapC family toxin [Candidatus Bipolaricaulota bacterium]